MSERKSEATPPMYDFYSGDKPLADLLVKALRAVLRRPDLSAQLVAQIAIFLKACERLPLVTPSVGMRLTLTLRETSGSSNYQSMKIDDESICLDDGNTCYDPAIGGDHESHSLLEIGSDWREIECGWGGLKSWIDSFIACADDLATEIDIEDFAESEVDWNDKSTGDTYWDQLRDDDDEE